MAKNLVVCLDGTNNEFGRTNTNVVRLYQILETGRGTQVSYYDPGVGTVGHPGAITRFAQKFTQTLGMAFGLGVTQNVMDAYAFLLSQYEEMDRIYLFGFSRGALEARALAGLLHRCGLLKPELVTLVPYPVRMFQTVGNDEQAAEFKATFSRPVRTHFLGLWDTVTSFGNVWSPIFWPNTTNNPGVVSVRHAVALDERRAFFRQNRWAQGEGTVEQDVRERWFAGVHCDVGGGYPAGESSLWKVSFAWMIAEAVGCGLQIDEGRRAQVMATGGEAGVSCGQNWLSFLHDSMPGLGPVWYLAEFVPRRRYVGKDAAGKARYRWLWPVRHWFAAWLLGRGRMGRARAVGRARKLKGGDRVHRSVLERFAADPGYRPDSLLHIGLTGEAVRRLLVGQEEYYEVPMISAIVDSPWG
ncbi:MAG: DUF2235 domain-containing protein [Rhodospirillales bacterium]|nr:DUF2235 domain-containing protein [Acetobacter sp.]